MNNREKVVARGKRAKRKVCSFCVDKIEHIDYKDAPRLRRYLSERGKILAPPHHRHLRQASASADRRHQACPSHCAAALCQRIKTAQAPGRHPARGGVLAFSFALQKGRPLLKRKNKRGLFYVQRALSHQDCLAKTASRRQLSGRPSRSAPSGLGAGAASHPARDLPCRRKRHRKVHPAGSRCPGHGL